jgi:glycopeptide antibiotics resistance protein
MGILKFYFSFFSIFYIIILILITYLHKNQVIQVIYHILKFQYQAIINLTGYQKNQ